MSFKQRLLNLLDFAPFSENKIPQCSPGNLPSLSEQAEITLICANTPILCRDGSPTLFRKHS